MSPFSSHQQSLLASERDEQFWLSQVQLLNWGTFANVHVIDIAREGYLITGGSGSGKSSLLDGHAATTTPPKWRVFNRAARESERSQPDRTLVTYVRGAYATQTTSSGEHALQFVRTGTTWSAFVETYRNDAGRVVTLAIVLWVRGSSTSPSDVQVRWLTLEGEMAIQELEFFSQHDYDVRRFKTELPDAVVHAEFSGYQERFRRLLGIDNERTLRLLHKTQSAKDLGDLNTFLRDFMLDEPQTFDDAKRLVVEFGELDAAHQAVVAARKQVETLLPAQLKHADLLFEERNSNELSEVRNGLDHYRERRRRELLDHAIGAAQVELLASGERERGLGARAEQEFFELRELRAKLNGVGGGTLENLELQKKQAEEERPARQNKRDVARDACLALDWTLPDEVVEFVRLVEKAREAVNVSARATEAMQNERDEVMVGKRDDEREFARVVAEVRSLEKQPSNIPLQLLQLRAELARDLDLQESELPFVGELLQVKTDCIEWQPAIERVLSGFARSLLVSEGDLQDVSAWVNGRHLGQHLVYHRVLSSTSGNLSPAARSLYRKLDIARHHYADWLREELKTHFDYECVDNPAELHRVRRGVTREGQVKHNTTRYEKNDRYPVHDRTRWLLGFDNTDKLAAFRATAQKLADNIARVDQVLAELKARQARHERHVRACVTLQNMTWNEVDVASLVLHIQNLEERIRQQTESNPDIAKLKMIVWKQERVHEKAVADHNEQAGKSQALRTEIAKLESRKADSERRWQLVPETPTQLAGLDARFARWGETLDWENIGERAGEVGRDMADEQSKLGVVLQELRHAIVRCFEDFNRLWPAESGGLDANMASAADYFAKLARLQNDRLPQFEDRFLQLWREQSTQNLTVLSTRLNNEAAEIRTRMDQVNDSLRGAPFNPGTYLQIETTHRHLPDVVDFRARLREAQNFSFTGDKQQAEESFAVLQTLVKRLKSTDTVDINWRNLVLDVRLQVDFIAREFNLDGVEVDVYTSGAGKSGGQRQKLTTTCLAAALRYQLAGSDRALPMFSTVVIDEAFDKADAEFTTMSMNIFRNLGFQMLVATPMKGVMAVEPFIGGACFVHIKDRRKSQTVQVQYDSTTKRLLLDQELLDAQETPVA